ncbi:MAG: MAPEG family protein [Pseudomonadota bacterium]
MTGMTALLLFALWTLLMMFMSQGYRLSQIMTFKQPVNAYPRSIPNTDPAFFVRARDAHANCLENLPVFGAIVLAAAALGQSAAVDGLAYYVLLARVAQSVTHLIGTTVILVWIRAAFFLIQVALMIAMAVNLL